MSKRKARHYTEEFKLKAVRLSQVNGNINQTSRELNVPYSVLQRWRKEYDTYGENSFPGKGKPKLTDQEKEIVKLENQLRELQLENDILKKAISIFSKSDRKNTNL